MVVFFLNQVCRAFATSMPRCFLTKALQSLVYSQNSIHSVCKTVLKRVFFPLQVCLHGSLKLNLPSQYWAALCQANEQSWAERQNFICCSRQTRCRGLQQAYFPHICTHPALSVPPSSLVSVATCHTHVIRSCFQTEHQHPFVIKQVPWRTEVSQWFGDDSSLKAFLHKPLKHRIGVWHIQVNIWYFTVNSFVAL